MSWHKVPRIHHSVERQQEVIRVISVYLLPSLKCFTPPIKAVLVKHSCRILFVSSCRYLHRDAFWILSKERTHHGKIPRCKLLKIIFTFQIKFYINTYYYSHRATQNEVVLSSFIGRKYDKILKDGNRIFIVEYCKNIYWKSFSLRYISSHYFTLKTIFIIQRFINSNVRSTYKLCGRTV